MPVDHFAQRLQRQNLLRDQRHVFRTTTPFQPQGKSLLGPARVHKVAARDCGQFRERVQGDGRLRHLRLRVVGKCRHMPANGLNARSVWLHCANFKVREQPRIFASPAQKRPRLPLWNARPEVVAGGVPRDRTVANGSDVAESRGATKGRGTTEGLVIAIPMRIDQVNTLLVLFHGAMFFEPCGETSLVFPLSLKRTQHYFDDFFARIVLFILLYERPLCRRECFVQTTHSDSIPTSAVGNAVCMVFANSRVKSLMSESSHSANQIPNCLVPAPRQTSHAPV